MDAAGFDRTYREGEELQAFFNETDEKFGTLLTTEAMRSVNSERYNSMAWPTMLLVLIGLTLVAIAAVRVIGANKQSDSAEMCQAMDSETSVAISGRGVLNFVLIVGGVVLYCAVVEQAGFLLAAGGLLFLMLLSLGTRIWVSAAITVVCVPIVWQLFAGLLRVPLPPGEWGL